jgi:hypothetical protein
MRLQLLSGAVMSMLCVHRTLGASLVMRSVAVPLPGELQDALKLVATPPNDSCDTIQPSGFGHGSQSYGTVSREQVRVSAVTSPSRSQCTIRSLRNR